MSTPVVSVYEAVAGVGSMGMLLIVIVVVAVAEAAGPVFSAMSSAAPESNCGVTVPLVLHVAVTVRVAAEVSVPGSNEHVAVPVFEKSSAMTPVTASLNVRV